MSHSRTNLHIDRPGDPSTELFSHHGLIVRELAKELLSTVPGERLARIQEYATRFDASVGSVQAALSYLQSTGAARLEARGRLGTFVAALHYPLLWTFASPRPIAGALPLPYSRRIEGLATGVRAAWASQPPALDLRFVRGSGQRLQALAVHQCDWALVSRFAAQTAHAHGFAVDTVMVLGPQTYMARHVLLTRGATALRHGMRMGVDVDSADHVVSVRAASRGTAVDLVPIEYSRGLELLQRTQIDATVWSEEDIPAGADTYIATPLDPTAEPALAELGEAALVVHEGNRAMSNVLHAILDPVALVQIQQEVVERKRLPTY
jgi:hypothetical protein